MSKYNIFHSVVTRRSLLRTHTLSPHLQPRHKHSTNTTRKNITASLATMSKPGLLFVTSRISDPSKTTDEKFNEMYDKEHLPDVLNYKKKVTDLALRYKNSNPSSTCPYLALYPLKDTSIFSDGTLENLTTDTRHSKTYNGEDLTTFIDFGARHYEKIQTYEGGFGLDQRQHQNQPNSQRAQSLTVVAMEPAPSSSAEADFDAWYRKQHLDMLAMCTGYRRTTRYKRIDGVEPRYLALHEWDCKPEAMPAEQIKQVTSTEWSRKIIGEARVFERDVFELIQEQGEVGREL